ncbi:MAG: purine-nucleoside phosphorylase [Coraliomargarita sp.]|nr:purine-nucleoside phosphorylase [Coraliomargarita sp.]
MSERPKSLPEEIQAFQPEVGLVLGSGLGFFADDRIEVAGRVDYKAIDGFPVSTVPGHAGRFVYGMLGDKRVLCMQGRFHFYEGYSMAQLTLPIRLMAGAGVRTLFVTNAAGGINPKFQVGDFMLIRDHINLLGTNPLIGMDPGAGVRFPDMTEAYDRKLGDALLAYAESARLALHTGVYLATTGPSFETPAEIRAFAALGADAVGMSTVPEVIVARQQGMRALGISCITNAAAGISDGPLTHEEVSETADRVRPDFADLLAKAVSLAD